MGDSTTVLLLLPRRLPGMTAEAVEERLGTGRGNRCLQLLEARGLAALFRGRWLLTTDGAHLANFIRSKNEPQPAHHA